MRYEEECSRFGNLVKLCSDEDTKIPPAVRLGGI
jgi:hypothetical protein